MSINISEQLITPPTPWHVPPADKLLWDFSGPCGADRLWRHKIFRRLPDDFGQRLAHQYTKDWKAGGSTKANTQLRCATDPFLQSGLPSSADEDDLERLAKLKAEQCIRIASYKPDQSSTFKALSTYTTESGVKPPSITPSISIKGAIKRLCNAAWWKRRLRKALCLVIEKGAIHGGLVHKKRNVYVSDENLARKREQNRHTRSILEALVAVNEQGDSFTLQELSDLSVSNPVIRRNELMTRLAGYELYADQEGYNAYFLTLTCPSRFHARFGRSGDENPNYDKSTPKEAQDYLNKIWQQVRSRWKYYGIKAFGVRIAEPHHDGTPHWHILIFLKENEKEQCLGLLKKYALKESPDENGAKEHRFKIDEIDFTKGSAVGYVAKYISKNVDGYGIDTDELGNCAASSAERVKTWASTWGIRQFQDFGGPPVTIWRELRRIPSPIPNSPKIEQAREAADDGQWADFITAMGGVCVGRADRPVGLLTAWSDKPNYYDEPAGEIIFGVTAGDVTIQTRIHIWEIKPKAIEPVEDKPSNYRTSLNLNQDNPLDTLGFEAGKEAENSAGYQPALTYLEFCQ